GSTLNIDTGPSWRHTRPIRPSHRAPIETRWIPSIGLQLELLPLHHSTPPPFTLEECRNLNAFLQSIDQQGEMPLRTHAISRILLKSVSWRQSHFRAESRYLQTSATATYVGRTAQRLSIAVH
ncbi:hypothetical protein BD779DRAFT_1528648, partial [Infundibulicybe gibba]